MQFKSAFAIGAFASALLPALSSAHAEGYTTRIETRPFYGATVTLESGVRVIRALPPERQVIINPNGTPLSLGFNETRVYEQSSVYNYAAAGVGGGGGNGDVVYGAPYLGYGLGLRGGRGRFGNHFNGHFGNHGGAGHGVGGVR